MQIIIFLIFIVTPVFAWYKFCSWQDRAEPEPKKLLLKTFFLGVLAAFLIALFEYYLGQVFLGPNAKDVLTITNLENHSIGLAGFILLASAGFIEETGKFLFLKGYIYDKTDFNQIADGVFYAISLALGFSFLENIFYFIDFANYGGTLFLVAGAAVRGLFSTTLHVLATSISGLALGRKKFRVPRPWVNIFLAVLLASCLHAAYNVLIQFGAVGVLAAFLLLVLAFSYIVKAINKQESKIIWRLITPVPKAP